MARKKISQLESATDVTASDLIQIVDVEDSDMAVSGTNKKATAQLLANELGKLTNVTATGSTTARSLVNRFADVVNVKDFGAVGNGVADDTAAFSNAIAASNFIVVPSGTYRLTSTITLNKSGHSLIGIGGKNTTILSIDHTTGPGVTLAQNQCVMENLTIIATNTRRNFTMGGVYDLAADLFGVKIYNNGGYLTQCRLDRVSVQRHPNHGIYMGGEGAGTIFTQCESNRNRGHGYAFDDRTIGGGSPSRCGIVNIESCRGLDNGGNALNLSQIGQPCYRFIVNNFETIWNAWNTNIAGLQNAEVFVAGENYKFQQCAVADVNGDTRTFTDGGDARLAKSAGISTGIYVGSSSNNIILENCRYISCYRGVATGTLVNYLRVIGAYFTQQQISGGPVNVFRGFDIGTAALNLHIDVPQSQYVTTMVVSNTLQAFPLVVNRTRVGTYNITGAGTFENVIEETVYLPAGFYRITACATVQNAANATTYSVRVAIGGTGIARSNFASVEASAFATLPLTFIHEQTTSETVTVALQIRQATGPLFGSVLESNNTFGHTTIQVERIR